MIGKAYLPPTLRAVTDHLERALLPSSAANKTKIRKCAVSISQSCHKTKMRSFDLYQQLNLSMPYQENSNKYTSIRRAQFSFRKSKIIGK